MCIQRHLLYRQLPLAEWLQGSFLFLFQHFKIHLSYIRFQCYKQLWQGFRYAQSLAQETKVLQSLYWLEHVSYIKTSLNFCTFFKLAYLCGNGGRLIRWISPTTPAQRRQLWIPDLHFLVGSHHGAQKVQGASRSQTTLLTLFPEKVTLSNLGVWLLRATNHGAAVHLGRMYIIRWQLALTFPLSMTLLSECIIVYWLSFVSWRHTWAHLFHCVYPEKPPN